MRLNTAGSVSGKSSAINPGPASRAASPCIQTPMLAASKAGTPCAIRPAMMPASTSPAPAVELRAAGMLVADVAEQPRKLALMRRQHDLRVGGRFDRFKQSLGRIGK